MDLTIPAKLERLALYMKSLPKILPSATPQSKTALLAHFTLNPGWLEDIGEEGAVNRALEVALGSRNDKGVFEITERGIGLEKLAEVLKIWLEKFPDSILLQKWVSDSLTSAQKCFDDHGQILPASKSLQDSTFDPAETTSSSESDEEITVVSTAVAKKTRKTKGKGSSRSKGSKPDTKVLKSIDDARYSDEDEGPDTRKGGKRIHTLLPKITRLCHKKGNTSEKRVRCIASAGCDVTWASRDLTRVLNHAATCGWLVHLPGGGEDVSAAIEALAARDPGILEALKKKMMSVVGSKRQEPDSGFDDESNSKRSKTADDDIPRRSQSSTPGAGTSTRTNGAKNSSAVRGKGKTTMEQFKTAGREAVETNANIALTEWIVCSGVAPHAISHPTFQNLISVFKTPYKVPHRTTLTETLIPRYAITCRLEVIKYLQTCRYLNISFDGGKLTRKKFLSVHITTAERDSFCLELDRLAGLSLTGEYVCELLMKWITQIGQFRFAGMTSDDASNCNKGRRLVVERCPRIFNLADVCHNMHNACKDICNIPEFASTIKTLRELLAFMSLSDYTRDLYDSARTVLSISRGLQSIGETRFATIYWSIDSVLNGYPAFLKIAHDANGIDSNIIDTLFGDDEKSDKFRRDLSRLAALLMPFARAIQCLHQEKPT